MSAMHHLQKSFLNKSAHFDFKLFILNYRFLLDKWQTNCKATALHHYLKIKRNLTLISALFSFYVIIVKLIENYCFPKMKTTKYFIVKIKQIIVHRHSNKIIQNKCLKKIVQNFKWLLKFVNVLSECGGRKGIFLTILIVNRISIVLMIFFYICEQTESMHQSMFKC